MPLYKRSLKHVPMYRFLPGERALPVPPPWPEADGDAPEELRTVVGVWRRPAAEDDAYRNSPLHDYFRIHWEATVWFLELGWHYLIPTMPRIQRATQRARRVRARPTPPRSPLPPAELKELIAAQSRLIGLHAIGFAAYDPRYTFAEYAGQHETGTVVVCISEQDYEATQTLPSNRAEKAAHHAYAEVMAGSAGLAEFIHSLGYRANAHTHVGEAIVIHYGVEAGLGQLGLNGQLLTPVAGSRARISLITTDLGLPHDRPRDFGIHKICDACQVCIRRCPTGAIPAKREESRGILKAKIKTERCLPVVAQVHGCGICMKVCPVQRYGLETVIDHYLETGAILGKDSDELEGFDWPLDDRHYGPTEKPRIDSQSLLKPMGLKFDPSRTAPPEGAPRVV